MKSLSRLIAVIDQSTTATKITLYDLKGKTLFNKSKPHQQITPKPGFLQHDPNQIYRNTLSLIKECSTSFPIYSISITNQRQTLVVWSRKSKQPLYNAIVWSDKRTQQQCQQLKSQERKLKLKTGLPISPYFSGFKFKWLYNNFQHIREAAQKQQLMLGTVDTWLVYKLSGKYLTDHTNASRTYLYNIQQGKWDQQLSYLFNLKTKMLPQIQQSAKVYGQMQNGIKIAGILGDQQSAAFGLSIKQGQSKTTYGTGCFMLINLGNKLPSLEKSQLIITVLNNIKGKRQFAYQGSIQAGGSVINWAKDSLGLFNSYEQLNTIDKLVKDNGQVYFYPYLSGILSPHWNDKASGVWLGLSAYTRRQHLIRALLQSIAYRVNQVTNLKNNPKINNFYVDGGLTQNSFLMQFQSDLLCKGVKVCHQGTSWGAAKCGLIAMEQQIPEIDLIKREYKPQFSRQEQFKRWEYLMNKVKEL